MKSKFDGIICLDLSPKTSYKKKKSIIDFLTSNGATVSFILNKKSKFLVIDDMTNTDTYKCRTAFKLRIPVLLIDFFYHSLITPSQELKVDDYIVRDKSIEINFKKGKINTENLDKEKLKVKSFELNKFKPFNVESDPFSNEFDSVDYQILKWIVFHDLNGKNHVLFEINSNTKQFRLRIENVKNLDHTVKLYYTNEAFEVYELYQHLTKSYLTERYNYDKILPEDSGSSVLKRNYFSSVVNSGQILNNLADFINYIWSESVGHLETIFDSKKKSFGLATQMLDKSELILYQQRDEFVKPKDKRSDFTNNYYLSLPFKNSYEKKSLMIKKNLNDQFELIQVLRDMLNIGEETNWYLRSSVQSIYRSIGCHIFSLLDQQSNEDYNLLLEKISNSSEFDSDMEIMNIYAINRPNEALNFNKNNLSNVKLLFHGSKVSNVVGILSRGLLTPKNIVCSDGPDGSDPLEMLGYGIYFSDSFNTSLKYSQAGNIKHTRLVLICEVALGKCKELYEFDYSLTEAPKGYDSVHGVKNTSEKHSAFQDSEYCVYKPEQCKIKYIVEINPKSVSIPNIDCILSNDENSMVLDSPEEKIDLTQPKFTETKSSLKTLDGKNLPLKSIHVRAQIIDMVSKVTIFQEYENNENQHIEAEYLFPLIDTATVCNFEAFINDKHVIGVCKEKEVARREYREAIRQGKGAYLIDQETNEIFKVNVGNLPPKAKCVIKITYVSEMDIQNEQIYFRLPSNVCQWKALEERENLQDTVVSRHINRMKTLQKASFKACVIMPFEIRSIKSYTHAMKIKQTACQAVVEMDRKLSKSDDDDTLIIAIEIATIHMPRMFVEEFFDEEEKKMSRACMVSFYPEFGEDDRLAKHEKPIINFLLDCSNSLNENNLIQLSKKLVIMMLNYMPKDSLFNVTIFGTEYDDLFPYPLTITPNNLKQATDFIVNKVIANKGNTDLLNFVQNEDRLNLSKNYVLISDGHMTRSNELIAYLNQNNRNRIFTCSIGNLTNNNHLLKLIANLTKSHYSFYDKQNQSKWKEKIEDLMDKIRQPSALSDIRIDWQNAAQTNEENFDYNCAPNKINCLFNGRRVLAYGFMPNCQQAVLKASINGYEFETLVTCPELMITRGDLIHKLTAKALIDDWQNGILCTDDKIQNDLLKQKLKNKIIKLSKKFSITSEYTSFIAIEDRDKNEPSNCKQVDVKELLKKNDVTIDILPYMAYETNLIQEEEKFSFDEMDLIDQIRLFNFYHQNEDLMNTDEVRIFMAKQFKKYVMIDKAFKCFESCENKFLIEQELDELKNFDPKITIKTLTGRTFTAPLKSVKTLDELKNFILEKTGTPLEQQTLVLSGKRLERDLLSDSGISDGDVVHLVLRLRGGPVEENPNKYFKESIFKLKEKTKISNERLNYPIRNSDPILELKMDYSDECLEYEMEFSDEYLECEDRNLETITDQCGLVKGTITNFGASKAAEIQQQKEPFLVGSNMNASYEKIVPSQNKFQPPTIPNSRPCANKKENIYYFKSSKQNFFEQDFAFYQTQNLKKSRIAIPELCSPSSSNVQQQISFGFGAFSKKTQILDSEMCQNAPAPAPAPVQAEQNMFASFDSISVEDKEEENLALSFEECSSRITISPMCRTKKRVMSSERQIISKTKIKNDTTNNSADNNNNNSIHRKKIKVIDFKSASEFISEHILNECRNWNDSDLKLIKTIGFKIKTNNREIDCAPLIDFIILMGLNSLGEQVAGQIKELIINFVVLIMIVSVFNKNVKDIKSFEELNNTVDDILNKNLSSNNKLVEEVRELAQKSRILQLKYPNACDSLELGRNWDKFLEKLIFTN